MGDTMLQISELSVRYGRGSDQLTAVDKVSLSVPSGGTLGLVGESGSGKSTIGRALLGLTPTAGGRILLGETDVSEDRLRQTRAFRRRVQMVFQDPYSSLNPRMTISDTIAEALAGRKELRTRGERVTEIERLLGLVGLARTSTSRYPHQFSGGQRQRIAIARALAVRPDVIVMDEVTSALDVSVQASVLRLLKDLQRELGVAYLFISHDLAVVNMMSDIVAVMYLGQIVETERPERLFTNPQHPYTRALIGSIPRFGAPRVPPPVRGDVPDPRQEITGCRFRLRCPEGPIADPTRTLCAESDPQRVAHLTAHAAACHYAQLLPAANGRGESRTVASTPVRPH